MTDIRHERLDWGDIYEGRKQALIDHGIVKAEYFPSEPQFDKWGRTQRTFYLDDPRGRDRLRQRGTGDYWEVQIKLPEEQVQLRQAERMEERARKEQQSHALDHRAPGMQRGPGESEKGPSDNDSRPVSVEEIARSGLVEQLGLDHARMLYTQMFPRVAKLYLWNLHLLFEGETGTPAKDGYLPFRLSAAQRGEARDAFVALFGILETARLERSPVTTAKADTQFQRFLQLASSPTVPKTKRGERPAP